jgi:hypothetical protein
VKARFTVEYNRGVHGLDVLTAGNPKREERISMRKHSTRSFFFLIALFVALLAPIAGAQTEARTYGSYVGSITETCTGAPVSVHPEVSIEPAKKIGVSPHPDNDTATFSFDFNAIAVGNGGDGNGHQVEANSGSLKLRVTYRKKGGRKETRTFDGEGFVFRRGESNVAGTAYVNLPLDTDISENDGKLLSPLISIDQLECRDVMY